MLVEIHDNVFEISDSTKAAALFIVLANSRHIIIFDDKTEAFKNWSLKVGKLGLNAKNYLMRSVAEINSGASSNRIIVHRGETDWNFDFTTHPKKFAALSYGDALRFCSMPAKIFVENAESDRAFILAFLNPQKRSVLEMYEANGWVQFIHGGGIGDLKKHIEKEVKLFPGAAIRCFALFDNDGLMPGAPSAQAMAVSKVCSDNMISFHQLSRRCIENYLPGNLLMIRKWNTKNYNGHTISLFCRLPESFRDHFNMKGGLDGDAKHKGKKPDFPYDHKYAIKKFAKGFGDKAWEGFIDKHFDTLVKEKDKDVERSKKELDAPLKVLMEQL